MGIHPVEMEIVKIVCHKDYERPILCALQELGLIEFIDVERKGAGRTPTKEENAALSLLGTVSRIVDYLGLDRYQSPKEKIEVDDKDINNVLSFAKEVLGAVQAKVEELREREEKLSREKM
mgnify:CR=1 FL=1